MPPSTSRADGVLIPIQFLRGIAAMMVVWHHALEQLPQLKVYFPGSFGALGVDLFFVLSGLIMGVTTAGRDTSPRVFIVRRIIRIVPLYWATTLLIVAMALAAPALFKSTVVTWPHVLQSLLFIPHWSPAHPGQAWPILVPGWSLNYEMFFYLAFAVSLVLPERIRAGTLLAFFAGLVSVGALFGPFDNAAALSFTSWRLLEFAAGVVISRLFLRGLLELPALLALAMFVIGWVFVASSTQTSILFGCSLVVCAALSPRALDLRLPLLKALGDASYSIYLTHVISLGVARVVWTRLAQPADSLARALTFVVVGLAISALLGWLVYVFAEKPMTRWLNAKLAEKAGARADRVATLKA